MDPAYGLLLVGGGGRQPPADCAALAAAARAEHWWQAASFGRFRPCARLLPPVMLGVDPAGWCAGGGMGVGPRNAAGLVRAALSCLPPGTACPDAVVMVLDAPVAPHAWRVADGGVPVTPGQWVRRYAALPRGATLGAWAHELAHLLLRWPDLPGSACLMGVGAHRGNGWDPAPPNPSLALAAGWLTLLPADPTLPASALVPTMAMALDWRCRALLVTCDGAEFRIHDRLRPGPALATGRVVDPGLPLLSGIAAALAGLA